MNIAIFYHIHQVNHWKKIYEWQYSNLKLSGLYDAANYIHFGINGGSLLWDNKASQRSNLVTDSESDTLKDLYRFCRSYPNYKVLYIHTKGVTYPENNHCQTSWLRYLEHFNVIMWEKCVELLEQYDCVGTDWTTRHPNDNSVVDPHYSGNFWWANSSYISRLDPNYLNERRHNSEYWIGTGNPKYFNFFSSNRNKYLFPVLPEEYLKY